jgi:Fe-Mn family superoxide dismutase
MTVQMKHLLPPLPYDYAALEPHISAHTMMLHHGRHHASYVANLNSALKGFPALQGHSALSLLRNVRRIPQQIRTAVRNNAAGHVNHSLFWRSMTPPGSGEASERLAQAIDRDFGGLDQLKARFLEAGSKLFGSGWVWLTSSREDCGLLQVRATSGHDNPQLQGYIPILVNDVWEHAYYLDHEDRRGEYLARWWPVVNWEEAARRYENPSPSAERRFEEDAAPAIRAMI